MITLEDFLNELTKEETRNPIWIMSNAKRLLKELHDNEALHITNVNKSFCCSAQMTNCPFYEPSEKCRLQGNCELKKICE